MKPRTEAQKNASRTNGTKSKGPVTAAGKHSSSLNAVKTGFTAEALLLPNETRQEYEEMLACWRESLRPASPAEARLAAQIADLDFRLQRLMRIENRQALSSVHSAIRKTTVFHRLLRLRKALPLVEAMVRCTTDVRDLNHWKNLEESLPVIKSVAEIIAREGAMPELADELGECTREVVMDALLEDVRASWARLTEKAKEVEARFREAIAECEQNLEAERQRLLTEQSLGDEKEMKRVLRHRKALQNERDRALSTYKITRELVQGAPVHGPIDAYTPVVLELRLVGSTAEVVPQKK